MALIHDGSQGLFVFNNQLLLMLRDQNDKRYPFHWCLIGGGTEPGETPEQTLLREAQEEISVTPSNLHFLFSRPNIDDANKTTSIFYVPMTEKEVKQIKLGDEGIEVKFFDFKDVAKLPVVPSLKVYWPKYLQILEP